ncbi:hypothetical protein [Glaciihabitans sp. dw_435]|uniref:hypothetical protein n=1 Tax=Glaciihabitans sp. dw_435 TaxID=2720081 RepID=UPI001BD491AD|nr:hypothetical protein [Glaciihabitans sp. dw_435]
MNDRKLRISHLVVQAVLVYDDGDELTPGPALNPVSMPLSQLGDFAERLPQEVVALATKLSSEVDSPDQ